MSATIYYLSDYARLRRRKQPAPAVDDDHQQQAIVTFGILIFAVVLIIIGVVLVEGIAAVGRSNSDCLQSGRRVCGLFHTAFVGTAAELNLNESQRDVAEMNHIAAHQAHVRAA
jgi:hypothetical protein